MPVPMVSLRDYTLRTPSGHTLAFRARKPTMVPDELVAAAMAVNIVPTKEYENEEMPGDSKKRAGIVGGLRDSIVLQAMKQLVEENEHTNFNAGGQPKLAVVNERTGLRLAGGELAKYWERFREIQSTNDDFPTHPRMEDVLELQGLTSRKSLLEFADAIKVDRNQLDKKSIREMKELLMYAAIHYNEAVDAAPVPDSFKKPAQLTED